MYYAVMFIQKTLDCEVNDLNEGVLKCLAIPLENETVVGMMPVFFTREAAVEFAGDESLVVPIEPATNRNLN